MPEYLAPGVYVEEVSFRSKSIEGVSTSIAGFIGPTRFGPPFGVPELLTSFSDFERIYGGLDDLTFEDTGDSVNYLAQGARAFFENGGQQLYVARTFLSGTAERGPYVPNGPQGCATATIASGSPAQVIPIRARWPGSYGDVTLVFTVHVSQNVLAGVPHDPLNPTGPKDPVLRGVNNFDTVWIATGSPRVSEIYWVENFLDPVTKQWSWRFHPESGSPITLSSLHPGPGGDDVRVVTVSVQVFYPGAFPRSDVFENLTFHPEHARSLTMYFATEPTLRSLALTAPIVFDEGDSPQQTLTSGPLIARIMLTQARTAVERGRLLRLLGLPPTDTTTDLSILATLGDPQLADTDRQLQAVLTGGLDGNRPTPQSYEGDDSDPKNKTALKSFEDLTDISIVAAPGFSAGGIASPLANAEMLTIANLLIAHCEKMRYRIAVLDSADGQDLTDVGLYRGQLDSKYAALYYPWVRILDPVSTTELNLPPSGFVAGLYADNDIVASVAKAPANMVVQLAIGFEVLLNKAQQDVLNPQGINCFRFFEGRGYRLWGARTISSDPEWKYVNLRRYFAFLEHSIDIGTQWVVFENNNEALWANVARTVSDFLFNEWKSGHLMGDKPEQAYFVRCDRSTMTQNDLDNGRLIVLVGVAAVKPAEFVIFRIGQWVGSQA